MIDDHYNIKRIIKIGSVVMEKGQVEVMRNRLIPLVEDFTILLYGVVVDIIVENNFVLFSCIVDNNHAVVNGTCRSLLVMEI